MKIMKKNHRIFFCENASEDKTLKENYAILEEINFEFKSPGTPQKNEVILWGLATLYSWMRTMMAHAILYDNIKTGLWSKCAATATKLQNIMVNSHEETFVHKKFYGKRPDHKKLLRSFGEMVQKLYCRYIPHVESTHKTYGTKP